MRVRCGSIGCLCLFLLTAPLAAADGADAFRTKFPKEIVDRQPVLVSARVDKGPTIDGEVDRELLWSQLPRSAHTEGAWTQIARKEASGRQTVVYSCFDDKNLYFGFVCEEPELQSVRMDGDPAKDDCVEVVIEVGGTQGGGDVYSFRANSRGRWTGWGLTGIPGGYHTPAWTSAGKFGPNRWMLEMAMPFDTIKRRPAEKGMACPPRGDVIGLKLVRWGAQQQDPKNRMVSVWNTDIAFTTPYIAGSNGLLCFHDANSLRDGDFTLAAGNSPWQRKSQVDAGEKGGMSLAKGASISQSVDVRPNCFYLISAQSKGSIVVLMDGKALVLKNGHWGFWSSEKQTKAEVTLQAVEAAKVDSVTMTFQPGEEPPGSYCLTDNYRHPERNIRELLPDAPDGRYQYAILDYQSRTVGDDNPAINRNAWQYDYNLRMEDVGGKKGWIPFRQGSLTVKKEPVFWQTDNPNDYVPWGRHDPAIEVDLGQEYYVRGLDVLMPAPNMINFEVWGKVKAEDPWVPLYAADSPFVEPSKRRKNRRAYESVRGVDSVMRYVLWRATQSKGDFVYPQMDGIQKFWVWGEPKGQHSGIKPFQPWMPKDLVPPVKGTTIAPDPDACQILPRPREKERTDGWFILGTKTRIVAQPDAEARKVAKEIQDEIRDRWQIEVPLAEETAKAGAGLDDVLYVGQPKLGALAERLRQEEKLTVEKRPQAYALRVSPRRAIVLGNDSDGIYWGVQSLMMAMRWHSSKDAKLNGLGVPCMKVEDWPATFDRGIVTWKGYPIVFDYIQSEIPRFMRNAQLLSRFKTNAVYSLPAMEGTKVATWPPGLLAKVCQQVRDQYHIEYRPMLLTHPLHGLQGWNRIVDAAKDYSVVESNPDESREEMGGALNLCPLNPKSYDLAFARIDELQEMFGQPHKMWLGGLVLHEPTQGARWEACRTCQKTGKSKDELFTLFAGKIAQHLRERQMTGLLEPYNVAFGDRDAQQWKRAIVVADVESLPRDFEYILPDGLSPKGMEVVRRTLNPSHTANGPLAWPSDERFIVSVYHNDLNTVGGTPGELAPAMEAMWYGGDKRPAGLFDSADAYVWLNAWRCRRDFPSWRAGDRPGFVPLDLRSFANHTGHPTGAETLEPGRIPAIDLRYVPMGRQVLSGVAFDIIDPAKNDGKSLLMMGRPVPGATHPKDAAGVAENAGPIPVGKKIASFAFLRTRWQATLCFNNWRDGWLRPTCRVVYDDDTWLPVDSFWPCDPNDYWNVNHTTAPLERMGWLGNSPDGSPVMLGVVEWVNPYPSKVVKYLDFFTPGFEEADGRKRFNPNCEAIVAITGVEPIEQDFNYWPKCANRPPLLPPRKEPRQAAQALQRVGPTQFGDQRCDMRLKGPEGEVASRVTITPNAMWATAWQGLFAVSPDDCQQVGCNTEYKPFGIEQTLEPAVKLCRVDLRGPTSGFELHYAFGRNHRVDVTVEISEDGTKWHRAGEVKGITADADFLPVEFDPVTVKKVRLTATAEPYREDYNPGMADLSKTTFDYPHFVWRLYSPVEKVAPKKP